MRAISVRKDQRYGTWEVHAFSEAFGIDTISDYPSWSEAMQRADEYARVGE